MLRIQAYISLSYPNYAKYSNHFFILGNGVCFANDSGLYDRAYCGARCPEYAIDYIKRLIKVGGILVAPVNDLLLQYERTGDETWEVKTLLSVSFAPLIMPQSAEEYSTQTIDMSKY